MVEQPVAPAADAWLSGAPDAARIARAIPAVAVLRAGSNDPQQPKWIGGRYDVIYVTGSEAATVILQFDRSLAGAPLLLSGSNGVNLQTQGSTAQIGPTGEAIFLLQLNEGYSSGRFVIRADWTTTVLRFNRVPAAAVASHETQAVAH